MKCPACGVPIKKSVDCKACGKWNGEGRPRGKKPFPPDLMFHEAIRTRAYGAIAGIAYVGANEESYEARDAEGRTAEEYAMEVGDLKALQMIRKGRRRFTAHARQEAFFTGILRRVGLAPKPEDLEQVGRMFGDGEDTVAQQRAEAARAEASERTKYIVTITFCVLGGILMFTYRPAGIAVAMAGILLGGIAGIKAMVNLTGAKAWFGMSGFLFLMMFLSVVAGSQVVEDKAASDAKPPAASKVLPPQKRQIDPEVHTAVIETRMLIREDRIQEAQARVITLLTDHPDDPEVKKLAEELKSHQRGPAGTP